ncbi:hypothetical protein SAMN02799620_00807 [Mycolicibacterium fluoranthenivorans]|uniref:Uncharacterized protein n=1 Tax=Mycolicibacterium fluoranthenivorans TaxID=258505 RepID=A0A1G4VH01_9MYCO|nr:hypothetical protein SAMN02799620_00807 [Mycolicibacterium fluoranthenivorans]
MRWRWRRRTAEAERRLAHAEESTQGLGELIQYSREMDARLRREVAPNGFGKAIQLAMRGRQA